MKSIIQTLKVGWDTGLLKINHLVYYKGSSLGTMPFKGDPRQREERNRVMAITPIQAASAVCEIKDWKATNLEVHKLIYIAHMYMFGKSDGKKKLISEPFEAWPYGPVLRSLYTDLCSNGANPIPSRAFVDIEIPREKEEYTTLKAVVTALVDHNSAQLVANTHREGGAWDKTYQSGKKIEIEDQAILEEYKIR